MVKRRILSVTLTGFLCAAAFCMLYPVLLTVIQSFREGLKPYLHFAVWDPDALRALLHSLGIAAVSAIGAFLVSLPAAFVFAKIPMRWKNAVFFLYIVLMMTPFQAMMLPQYLVAVRLGTYDTAWALILPNVFSPMPVFFLAQTLRSFPDEIIEAASLETSSLCRILVRVVTPAIRPGVACIGVLSFAEAWNAVSEPLILLESGKEFPLAVLLSRISASDGLAMAAVVLFLIPPMLLFVLFEEEITEGIQEYRLP